MKKLLIAFILFAGLSVQAWEQRAPLPVQECRIHAPYGFAETKKELQPICRHAFLVAYDPTAKIPAYVAYTLQPDNAIGCIARTNAFVADKSIKNGPKPEDYAGTGYDKGHVVPDGDLSWDQQIEYESFLMTNMVPQAGSLNRGIWKLLETSIRGWASQTNNSYNVIGGGIYTDKDKKIGSGVIVPTAYYKIVINNKTGEYAGWMFPHVAPYPNLGNDLTKYRLRVDDIRKQAGINFVTPKKGTELAPGSEWKVDFGKLTKDKRAKCGKND